MFTKEPLQIARRMIISFVACSILVFGSAQAQDAVIGLIKITSGTVSLKRDGLPVEAIPGTPLYTKDIISTGANSAVGMTFTDNSRLSLGPNSVLSLETYSFNEPGQENAFDSRLQSGSMTAASGDIAKSRPLSMRVLMPTTILGVRGTEFAARAGNRG